MTAKTRETIVTPPKRRAPPGTVDCHMHIFGPANDYPFSPGRSYTPPDALMPAYRHMCETVGIARTVVVHPSVYGSDNRCSADAVKALGDNGRGVAVIEAATSDEALADLDAIGFTGVRFNVVSGGGTDTAEIEHIAARIAPLGWHIQFYTAAAMLVELEPRLAALPVDIVIDHLGAPDPDGGVEQPGFQALLRLLANDRTWVKLSGAYRTDHGGAPWAATDPFARALVAARPDRMVFGTDWPHPSLHGPMPDDGQLFDKLREWCDGDDALIERVCVGNPVTLYGF